MQLVFFVKDLEALIEKMLAQIGVVRLIIEPQGTGIVQDDTELVALLSSHLHHCYRYRVIVIVAVGSETHRSAHERCCREETHHRCQAQRGK
jgi:hypothetical protein